MTLEELLVIHRNNTLTTRVGMINGHAIAASSPDTVLQSAAIGIERTWTFDDLAKLSTMLGTTLLDFEADIDHGYYPGEAEVGCTLYVRWV